MKPIKIVAFKLGEEEYGLNIDHVQSIERINHITRVPNAPSYVKGVINLRGNVTPVIDMRSRINLGETNYTEHTRVIISKFEEIELGLIVDQTRDVIDVAPEAIEDPSTSVFDSDYFAGVVKFNGRLIILINLESLLTESVK